MNGIYNQKRSLKISLGLQYIIMLYIYFILGLFITNFKNGGEVFYQVYEVIRVNCNLYGMSWNIETHLNNIEY